MAQLEIEPENTSTLFSKGVALAKLNKHKEAVDFYDKVLEINPEDEITLVNKGIALEHLPDDIRYKNKTYIKKAIDCYTDALKINPKNVEGLLKKGVALVQLNQYSKSLNYFNKKLSIKSYDLDIRHNTEALSARLEDFNEALDCFLKAFDLKPGDKDIIILFGILGRSIIQEQNYIDRYNENFEKVLKNLDFL